MSDSPLRHDGHDAPASHHSRNREVEKQIDIAEAEASKPLQSRRTNSPAQAKREMEQARAEIESTITRMRSRVEGEVNEAKGGLDALKRRLDVPARLRDQVRSEPWRSVAVAAGVGLGLALLGSQKKRGYDTLTKDEVEEIRAWRKERRMYLRRLETLMERSATAEARPSLRARIRARLSARHDDE